MIRSIRRRFIRIALAVLALAMILVVVIINAATVEEYRYEDCYFRVVEPDQVIAENLDRASRSRPIAD